MVESVAERKEALVGVVKRYVSLDSIDRRKQRRSNI